MCVKLEQGKEEKQLFQLETSKVGVSFVITKTLTTVVTFPIKNILTQ